MATNVSSAKHISQHNQDYAMAAKASLVKKILLGFFGLLALLSAIFMFKGWLDGHFASAETLRAYIETFGIFAPLVLILFQMLQVVLPVLPGLFGCIVGTGLFGPLVGFLCNYIGISLGSLAAFLLARHFGVHLVKHMISPEKYDRYVAWVLGKKSYIVLLWLSILLPLAPDDFLCYFSGLTGMSFEKFTWIIVLAKPWCILAYCLFFAYLL